MFMYINLKQLSHAIFQYFSLIFTSSVEVAMIMYLFTSFLCVTTKVLVVLVLSFVMKV